MLHAIVGLSDDGTREGVGLADVRAALEVTLMDLTDSIRLCEDKKVVVALELLLGRHIGELVTCDEWERGPR